jgi:hypothetical protein
MPIFSVDQFKAAIGNGGARPNQFMVEMFPPGAAVPIGLPSIPYLTSAASLPGQQIGAAVVQYRGREVKFAGDRVFQPWTTTFLNDTSLTARTICENWMQIMENRVAKVGITTPALYYGTLQVSQLNRNGAVMRIYRFTDVLPIDISEVGLDFGANDQVSTFTCTWAYQQFDILPVPGAPAIDAPTNIARIAN